MTYEICLLQAQELQNFVSPYNCEMIIFDFYSATEFKMIFLDKADSDLSRTIALKNRQLNRPHVCISNFQNYKEFSYAHPMVIFRYSRDTGKMIECYSFDDRLPNAASIQIEMIKLKELLLSGKPLNVEEDGISN